MSDDEGVRSIDAFPRILSNEVRERRLACTAPAGPRAGEPELDWNTV